MKWRGPGDIGVVGGRSRRRLRQRGGDVGDVAADAAVIRLQQCIDVAVDDAQQLQPWRRQRRQQLPPRRWNQINWNESNSVKSMKFNGTHTVYHKLEHYTTLAPSGAASAASSSGAGSIRVDPMYSKIELIPSYKTSLHGATTQVPPLDFLSRFFSPVLSRLLLELIMKQRNHVTNEWTNDRDLQTHWWTQVYSAMSPTSYSEGLASHTATLYSATTPNNLATITYPLGDAVNSTGIVTQ